MACVQLQRCFLNDHNGVPAAVSVGEMAVATWLVATNTSLMLLSRCTQTIPNTEATRKGSAVWQSSTPCLVLDFLWVWSTIRADLPLNQKRSTHGKAAAKTEHGFSIPPPSQRYTAANQERWFLHKAGSESVSAVTDFLAHQHELWISTQFQIWISVFKSKCGTSTSEKCDFGVPIVGKRTKSYSVKYLGTAIH